MIKIFSLIIILIYTFGHQSFANSGSAGEIEGCSSGIIKLEGMNGTDKAIALTNGHCIVPQLFFPSGEASSATKMVSDKQKLIQYYLYKDYDDLGLAIYVEKIIFATVNMYDFALIELNVTYDELQKYGHQVYSLSKSELMTGDSLTFQSNYLQKEDICVVDKKIPTIKEDVWTFKDYMRLKLTAGCDIIHGNSGTFGIKNGEVVAIVTTRYDGKKRAEPCDLNNPCEVQDDGSKVTAQINQAYVLPVNFLWDCYNKETGKFNFTANSCPIKIN